MKSYRLYLGIIFLSLFYLLGCKKDEIPNQIPFFSQGCKIRSFFLNGRLNIGYFVHYNSDSTLKGISINNDPDALVYSYKFSNQELTNIFVNLNKKTYLSFKYEYGTQGIELIRRYELDSFYDIDSSPQKEIKANEVSQYRFEYGKSGKPVSMVLSSLSKDSVKNIDVLKPGLAYNYEYDKKGNLIKEVYSTLDKEGKMQITYTSHHQYDDKANTLRQLYYMFYNPFNSAPYMFSENNKIATKTVYSPQYVNDTNYTVEYDLNGNVTNNGFHFSNIKWLCP